VYALASCLRGEVPASADWEDLVRQANDHLVTPRLHPVFSARADLIAGDLRDYVQFLHDLNLERNLRLKEQAFEAIGALNASGIHPTVLKGVIILLTCPTEELGGRMVSDLDLLLTPDDLQQGSDLLGTLGYRQLDGYVGEHAHGKFYRPQDAGMIDLHHRPPGPGKLYPTLELELGDAVSTEGCSFRVPPPASRVVHLIAHDMFNDGGLATGQIQLRHLFDIADLMKREEVDWTTVSARFSGARLSLAFNLYVLNLMKITKASPAYAGDPGMMAHLFFQRQMLRERNNLFRRFDDAALRAVRQIRQKRRSLAISREN
jgi:hypothetical protein